MFIFSFRKRILESCNELVHSVLVKANRVIERKVVFTGNKGMSRQNLKITGLGKPLISSCHPLILGKLPLFAH